MAECRSWFGQYEHLLLGGRGLQEEADHASELLAAKPLAPRYINHLRLFARRQQGDLVPRGHTQKPNL
jgi:hypothetical protein